MELCTTHGALSTPPLPFSYSHHRFLPNSHFRFPLPGVVLYKSRRTWLRASSDDSSSSFTEKKNDAVATIGDDVVTSSSVGNDVTRDKVSPLNVSVNEEGGLNYSKKQVESSDVEGFSSVDEALQPLKDILKNLNIELDVEDSPTILLYGGGALVAVWLLSAIIGAIDSIPVFPKLLEVVGLGYSIWFTSRYLLFKKSREELGSKINKLKQEVLGTNDE